MADGKNSLVKAGRGRPPFQPTKAAQEEVKRLVLLGANRERIADAIGIAPNTLVKYYGDTLACHQSRMLGKIAGKAYKMALDGNPFMVQFILRTRAGWKENLLSDQDTQLVKRVVGIVDADV